MKSLQVLLLVGSAAACVVEPVSKAQTAVQSSGTTTSTASDKQTVNTDVYIALLRRNVRHEKAEIMGSMMALNAQDAAKFWPIYSEYDQELAKLNDLRVANIKEYASRYNDLTDTEADSLVQKSMMYRKQRAGLLDKTYEKMKASLGGVTAARFAQVEDQLLLLIDLQIDSALPIVGQGS
jgi:hypothetical protein